MFNKFNLNFSSFIFLLKLCGSKSEREFTIYGYKRIFLPIFKFPFGLEILLITAFLYRKYNLILRESNINENMSSLGIPNEFVRGKSINFQQAFTRINFALIIYKKFLNIHGNLIKASTDKFLFLEYLWYLVTIKESNISFKEKIYLNGEYSPKEAAAFNLIQKHSNLNIVLPISSKFSDNYYQLLSNQFTNFIILGKCSYFPTYLSENVNLKSLEYEKKSLNIKKTKDEKIIIGLFFTTFMNVEKFRRINQSVKYRNHIVNKAVTNTLEKFGNNVEIVVRPHPREYKIFLRNNFLKRRKIKIEVGLESLNKIDYCISAYSSVVYQFILKGMPFVLVKEIDSYYPYTENKLFNNEIIPSFQTIRSCPKYAELIELYKSNNLLEKIQDLIF